MSSQNTHRYASSAALALALGAALSLVAASASAAEPAKDQPKEKCFGVTTKGKNDCAAGPGTSCAGTSKADYKGSDWKFVPKGSCETIVAPNSPTGHGQLQAFKEKPAK